MNIDLPTLAGFLSRPIRSVEVALPTRLEGSWPWPPKVRTNIAVIRTDEGALLFHYGLVSDGLLDGISEDNPFEGFITEGTLSVFSPDDSAAEQDSINLRRPFKSLEPLEMVNLDSLFPEAGRIFVPDATACEVFFTQTIRHNVFRFDVSGVRIYSSEASTLLEGGSGGVLECSIQS